MDINKLRAGDKVIFISIPFLSCLKTNEKYLVEEVSDKSIYFVNQKNGGKTDESIRLLKLTSFKVVT